MDSISTPYPPTLGPPDAPGWSVFIDSLNKIYVFFIQGGVIAILYIQWLKCVPEIVSMDVLSISILSRDANNQHRARKEQLKRVS